MNPPLYETIEKNVSGRIRYGLEMRAYRFGDYAMHVMAKRLEPGDAEQLTTITRPDGLKYQVYRLLLPSGKVAVEIKRAY